MQLNMFVLFAVRDEHALLLYSVGFGQADAENTWKIKVADRKSLLNLH